MPGRELLVCTHCKSAIFVQSTANTAPRWSGKIKAPESRKEIGGQDDLALFKGAHQKHEVIEVELEYD